MLAHHKAAQLGYNVTKLSGPDAPRRRLVANVTDKAARASGCESAYFRICRIRNVAGSNAGGFSIGGIGALSFEMPE